MGWKLVENDIEWKGSRGEDGGNGEKSEGKNDGGESLIKGVINRKGNPEP